MATKRKSVPFGVPDAGSGVYLSKLSSELTLTNAKEQICLVMPPPSGSDIGASTVWDIPDIYVGTPKFILRGILDGTPANTLGVGVQFIERNLSDSIDTAYEAEDIASNATWTGYADEDEYEIAITLTPATAFTPLRQVYARYFRDNSAGTQTVGFLVTGLYFEFNDA